MLAGVRAHPVAAAGRRRSIGAGARLRGSTLADEADRRQESDHHNRRDVADRAHQQGADTNREGLEAAE